MYVRLGFSIAVTVDPEILVVDEIIAVGDEEFQRKCFDRLFELRQRGTTIVIVSHSLGILTDLCDEGVWLDHGRMKAFGDIRDVVEGYLRAVNEQEAGRTTNRNGSHGEPDRVGSGEVRITDVQYLDADGAEVSFLTPGERCIIRLHYSASEPISHAVFGLAFVHESGVNVSGPNSGSGEKAFQLDAGAGYVDFVVDSMTLQPGLFTLNTAVVDRGHSYELRARAAELRIRADSPVTEAGLVRLDGRWSLTQGESSAMPAPERKGTLR
jgi:ABC-2 type transport system ATP-binding protein/lipopolysaccharide transport system ATP-binding protein